MNILTLIFRFSKPFWVSVMGFCGICTFGWSLQPISRYEKSACADHN